MFLSEINTGIDSSSLGLLSRNGNICFLITFYLSLHKRKDIILWVTHAMNLENMYYCTFKLSNLKAKHVDIYFKKKRKGNRTVTDFPNKFILYKTYIRGG